MEQESKVTDDLGYVDYGYENSWREIPKAVIECIIKRRQFMAHKVDVEQYERGLTVYTCHHCKIRWRVDSTD